MLTYLQPAKLSKIFLREWFQNWLLTIISQKTMSYYVYYFKENVALNQLSKMREHLDKRTEDLGLSADDAEDRQSGNGRRRSSVWEGLAEVWKFIEYLKILEEMMTNIIIHNLKMMNGMIGDHYFCYNNNNNK